MPRHCALHDDALPRAGHVTTALLLLLLQNYFVASRPIINMFIHPYSMHAASYGFQRAWGIFLHLL